MEIRKIYFDLDGVMADFDRGVYELCGMDAFSHEDDKSDDIMWLRIKEVGHFYDKLELMPGAKELFDDLYARVVSDSKNEVSERMTLFLTMRFNRRILQNAEADIIDIRMV